GKEQEWGAAGSLLTHEQHRDLRAQQHQRDSRFERRRVGQLRQALAQRPIADLIVILQEQYECCWRQMATWRTARLARVAEMLALVDEAIGQAARQLPGRLIGIVEI